jgi:hypothetical protein
LRDSRWEDPTLDVVDRERRLLAQERAATEHAQVVRSDWTLLRGLATALCVALVAVYLLIWASSVQSSGGPEGYVLSTTFAGPLTGGSLVRSGFAASLYDPALQRSAQSTLLAPLGPLPQFIPYDHPPFEALLLAPVLNLPVWFAFALWTMVTGLGIGLAVGFLDGALPVTRPVGWVMSLGACSFLPVMRALMLGQNVPFVLLGLCGLYSALKRGYTWWAAVCLLLVALKPPLLPIILLLLLLQGYTRVLALFAGIFAGMTILTLPLFGAGWPVQYVAFLGSNNPLTDPSGGKNVLYSWFGFSGALFSDAAPAIVVPLFVVLFLASAALVAWTWLRSHGVPHDESTEGFYAVDTYEYEPQFDLLWALAIILVVPASLHPSPDDLALLVLPAWIIGAYATSGLWSAGLSRLWIATLTMGYALAPLATYLQEGTVQTPLFLLYVPLLTLSALLLTRQLIGRARAAPRVEPAAS